MKQRKLRKGARYKLGHPGHEFAAEPSDDVVFLDPLTCGIYKDGGDRFRIDPETGKRTTEIDDELGTLARQWPSSTLGPNEGVFRVGLDEVFRKGVLVPRYYDTRFEEAFEKLLQVLKAKPVTLGELEDDGIIEVGAGHGSPGNDMRTGTIPYVKVSDIRALRVNVNPTNLVTEKVAQKYWRGSRSGLSAWDLITPNRASSNIGEFAVLLPGEEEVVLTKEVFVIRQKSGEEAGWSPFYLLWAFCLRAVRDQWRRICLMQTNREDVGIRYREVKVPWPHSEEWAAQMASPFENCFKQISSARAGFLSALSNSSLDYIATARALGSTRITVDTDDSEADESEASDSDE